MTPGWAAWLFPAWFITILLAGTIGAWVMYPIAFDRGFEEADGQARHRHRIGDPKVELPRAGRLPLEPLEPLPPAHSEWMFFAGAQVQPQPGRDEYELMTAPVMTQATQTMIMTAATATATVEVEVSAAPQETPSAWTRRQALEMDAFINGMREESNYYQHMILADHLTSRGGHEDGA